ncbi:hypothetical protein XENOCAPTIV_029548, partial [Xenoophorus captivus]
SDYESKIWMLMPAVKMFSCFINTDLNIAENGITIITNSRGKNSGEAYVQFSSQEEADKALQKDRELIGHRFLSNVRCVNALHPYEGTSLPGFWRRHREGIAKKTRTSNMTSNVAHGRTAAFLFLLLQFFSPLAVSKILVEFRPDGRPSGEADVYFSCHRDALDAMSRDRMNMGRNFISDQKVLIGFIGYLE